MSDNEVTDYEQKLFDAYALDVYQSSDVDTLLDTEEKDLNKSIEKYLDSAKLKNIPVSKEDLKLTIVNNQVYFKTIPTQVIEDKILNIAIDKATKTELLKIVDNEKLKMMKERQ